MRPFTCLVGSDGKAVCCSFAASRGISSAPSVNSRTGVGEASAVCRPATDWLAVEVAGLTPNPRGKIAVVGHQSLTDNFSGAADAAAIETKPFFRDAFKRTRCLIPMSGYYTEPRIDWSQVARPFGPRRIALRHSELIGQPV